MRKILFIACVAVIAACTSKKVAKTDSTMSPSMLLVPEAKDVKRGETRYPGLTLAQLQKGKEIFDLNCGKCHGFKNPNTQTIEGWEKIVPPMAKKSKIDAEAENLVLKYVIVMSDKK